MTQEILALEDEPQALFEEPQKPQQDFGALKKKALRATLWTITSYGSQHALRLVNSLVLTRLLMPEYFGLISLVSTVVVGVALMSDIGLIPSVVQSPKGDEPDFLNTAWTIQALRGIGIFLILLVIAYPMSLLYHEPRMTSLISVIGLTVAISGFDSTNLLSMSRHLGVRRIFTLEFSTQILSLAVTITFAKIHPSVWAIVAGNLTSSVFHMGLSFYKPLIPGIRNQFRWDRDSLHSLVRFGKWIVLSTAFTFFASQSDRLILGKLVSFSLLGIYGLAYQVSDIPRSIINAFTAKVGFPFIAKMTYLPLPEFRKVFLKYRLRVLVVGAFLLSLMVHLGGLLVTIMYDRRYHAATWMVPILALGLWHTLMYATTMPTLFSLGKSKYSALGNGLWCAMMVTSIPVGFHFFGMLGAVVAVAAGDLPLYFVTAAGANREGVSTWRQDLLVTGIFVAMLGIGLAIRTVVVH